MNTKTDKAKLKEFLLNVHEKHVIELKKAAELPKAFWETYSSFCNTCGGMIILGVEEAKPKNIICGVKNVEKTLTSLWDQLSNTNKVSYRNINNDDVNTYDIDGNIVIIINVKEVPEMVKPVYIDNKIENSWIRTGDGDRKVTKEELASLIRNAQPCQDSLAAERFTMDDLDYDSIISYKEKVHKRYPKKRYNEMNNEKFLTEIGACFVDRNTNELKIKKGTVLFLGKCNSIKELYPRYHVDFFNRRGNNPRWIDRVTDDEPSDYEMNLYNFYSIVYEKMKMLLQESFSLDNEQLRIPISDFDETLRECLVNCIAHADYIQGYPSTKVDAYDGWFSFINPGKMLVSTKQFAIGGDSRPRNEVIMKLLRLLGASERQGFGEPLIYKNAKKNDFRMPEITTNIERTELKVWNLDLVDSYPNLTEDQKNVYRIIVKSAKPQSVNKIKDALGMTEYNVRKCIQSLESENLVRKIGNGSSTRYIVEMESVEYLTQLQMAMDTIKKVFH